MALRPTLVVTESVAARYAEWRRLWRGAVGDPFLHPGWHQAFVDAGGRDLHPVLIEVRLAGDLIGLLPMRRESDGVLRFLTAPRSDYEDALAAPGHGEEVASLLATYLLTQRFELAEVPEGSLLGNALVSRGSRPRPGAPCPGIRLTSKSVGDVTSRSSIRRHEKKLARRGIVRLEQVAPTEVDDALVRFMDQHVARWLAAGGASLFQDSSSREFYRRLLHQPDFAEFATFHVLRAGASDAAYHVGLTNGSVFIWYKPTFDLNLEADGPGEVLLKRLVEDAHAAGAGYFDFTRGNEAFKLRFANEHHCNQRFLRRLPRLPGIVAAVGRRTRTIGRQARRVGQRLLTAWGTIGNLHLQTIDAPLQRASPPGGFEFEFGEIDLVAFGALRASAPDYVTPERMRDAIARRKRGDRLLVVRRSGERVPTYMAWWHVDGAVLQEIPGAEHVLVEPGTAIVFDEWIAPGHEAAQVRLWATGWLGCEARDNGLVARLQSARRCLRLSSGTASSGHN